MEDGAQERLTIPVIGGGWAGCAAAIALADAGFRVVLYEAANELGGRARRVVRDGLPLDNGQHVIIGAYEQTAALIARLYRASSQNDPPLRRAPLAIVPFGSRTDAIAIRAWPFAPPYAMLVGLLTARGLSWRERFALARWFARLRDRRIASDATAAQLIADVPARARERLLAPLCLAALNTPPQRASAQVFANVLRTAFDSARGASDVLRPSTDLSAIFPDAVARALEADDHVVRMRSAATIAAVDERGVAVQCPSGTQHAPAVVVAVGPHQLAHSFAPAVGALPSIAAALASVERLEWEPIVTVYLGYDDEIGSFDGLVQLGDTPGQWIFDRTDILARADAGAAKMRALLAVVSSGSGPHTALPNDALVTAVDAQLRRLRTKMPRLVWSQVITEKRATYACTPSALRPASPLIERRIYLAGDYVDDAFPATLESAVRSGRAAAASVVADWRR